MLLCRHCAQTDCGYMVKMLDAAWRELRTEKWSAFFMENLFFTLALLLEKVLHLCSEKGFWPWNEYPWARTQGGHIFCTHMSVCICSILVIFINGVGC